MVLTIVTAASMTGVAAVRLRGEVVAGRPGLRR